MPEQIPHHVERVLDLRPHAGLQPLGLLQDRLPGAGLVQRALARLHRHMPLRSLGYFTPVHAAVARNTEGARLLPMQRRPDPGDVVDVGRRARRRHAAQVRAAAVGHRSD